MADVETTVDKVTPYLKAIEILLPVSATAVISIIRLMRADGRTEEEINSALSKVATESERHAIISELRAQG